MNAYKAVGAALAALLLTGCMSQDVIIHGDSGAVNVGVVTAELAAVKLSGKTGNTEYELGTYPIATVYPTVMMSWGKEDATSILQKDLAIRMETIVSYVGTKNSVDVSIDTTVVECPAGFMLGTCTSRIEVQQENAIKLYREKFSYLK